MVLSNHKKSIDETIFDQVEMFSTNKTKSYSFRLAQINKMYGALKKNEDKLLTALYKDLKKSRGEAYVSELGVVYKEISLVKSNLKKWMKSKKVSTPIVAFPSRSKIFYEPLGSVLIIGPWNYPLQLLLVPLVGAIAAGNCVVLKPSEYAPHTSQAIIDILTDIFPPSFLSIFQGGIDVSTQLLEKKFDHIFFTGSSAVGKVVAQKAAQNLTPTTLELGGKSPCIITSSAKLEVSVKRIIFGKFLNMGQTCIAPDYIYIDKSIKEEFLTKLKIEMEKTFGQSPIRCKHLGRIVNEKNFLRLQKFLKKDQIFLGGDASLGDLFIAPTILNKVRWSDEVMQEEIFGPILPVLEYQDLNSAINQLKTMDKPLALYVFSEDQKEQNKVLNSLSFGGGCINDTLIHVANYNLPFGGIGKSGHGSYHGKQSFYTFSHKKSISITSSKLDLALRYPPYSDFKEKVLRFFFK